MRQWRHLIGAFGAVAGAMALAGNRAGRRKHLLRVREPDRRCGMDVPARSGAQGDGEGARRQGDDEVRRERRRGRRRRAGDPRARAERLQSRVHHQLRLHELHRESREAVPEGHLHARDRVQDGPEPRHLQRALLRGPLHQRRHRRQDDEVQRPRLRRRVPDPRGPAGHQRVHPGARAASIRRSRCASSGRIPGTTRARSARPPTR